jgi:GntR family transcriptional regulator
MVDAADRLKLLQFVEFDPHKIVPHYQQLEEGLLEAIRRGRLAPGEPLPSERELAETLGISRMTVRRALTNLEVRGRLQSQVGKGWYVSPAKVEQHLHELTSFSADMSALGYTVQSELLDLLKIDADEHLAREMGISLGASVFLLKRRRFLDGGPTGLEKARISEQVCPGLDRFDFEHESLYRVMRDEYGLILAYATQQIEASRADSRESSLLEIEEGAPVLRCTRTAHGLDRVVVEYATGVYRGDRYKYRVRLEGDTMAGGVA